MKIIFRTVFNIMLGSLLLQGCSHDKVERRLDKKMAQENTTTRSGLKTEASESIANYPGLSMQQRINLTDLKNSTSLQMDEIQAESIKLRSLLIANILTPSYNAMEVRAIKARLKENEEKRLSLIFSSIDKANKIFGRTSLDNEVRERFARDFFEPSVNIE